MNSKPKILPALNFLKSKTEINAIYSYTNELIIDFLGDQFIHKTRKKSLNTVFIMLENIFSYSTL